MKLRVLSIGKDRSGLYQPAMEECRSGRRPYTRLDILNRETLDQLLRQHDIDPAAIGDDRLGDLAFAWRRLDPWPDAVEGLVRLKAHVPTERSVRGLA